MHAQISHANAWKFENVIAFLFLLMEGQTLKTYFLYSHFSASHNFGCIRIRVMESNIWSLENSIMMTLSDWMQLAWLDSVNSNSLFQKKPLKYLKYYTVFYYVQLCNNLPDMLVWMTLFSEHFNNKKNFVCKYILCRSATLLMSVCYLWSEITTNFPQRPTCIPSSGTMKLPTCFSLEGSNSKRFALLLFRLSRPQTAVWLDLPCLAQK